MNINTPLRPGGIDNALRGYAIAATPRSGSTHLCALLASTGVLGVPEELLDPKTLTRLFGPHRWHGEEMWQAIAGYGMTPNGIFGLKIFLHHLDTTPAARAVERIANLQMIFLERSDILGQAISWARAAQTDSWNIGKPVKHAPRYDAALIRFCMQQIVQQNARWKLFFASNGIVPLHVLYEDYIGAPQHTITQVAQLVGIDRPTLGAEAGMKIQRDELNELWRQQFLREQQIGKQPERLTQRTLSVRAKERLSMILRVRS